MALGEGNCLSSGCYVSPFMKVPLSHVVLYFFRDDQERGKVPRVAWRLLGAVGISRI